MLQEAHFLTAETENGAFRFSECDCPDCQTSPASEYPLGYKGLMAEFVRETYGIVPIRLVVQPDMLLPLATGEETQALCFVRELHDLLEGAGFPVIVSDRPIDYDYATGDLARITRDIMGVENVPCLEGMLATIQPDPWAVCSPGVSVLIQIVGTDENTSLWCRDIEPAAAPSNDDFEYATSLARDSTTIYQSRHGWLGMVQVGNRRLSETKALGELLTHLRRLPSLWEAENKKEFSGILKRIARLVAAFALHPQGAKAVEFQVHFDAMRKTGVSHEALHDYTAGLEEWIGAVCPELVRAKEAQQSFTLPSSQRQRIASSRKSKRPKKHIGGRGLHGMYHPHITRLDPIRILFLHNSEDPMTYVNRLARKGQRRWATLAGQAPEFELNYVRGYREAVCALGDGVESPYAGIIVGPGLESDEKAVRDAGTMIVKSFVATVDPYVPVLFLDTISSVAVDLREALHMHGFTVQEWGNENQHFHDFYDFLNLVCDRIDE